MRPRYVVQVEETLPAIPAPAPSLTDDVRAPIEPPTPVVEAESGGVEESTPEPIIQSYIPAFRTPEPKASPVSQVIHEPMQRIEKLFHDERIREAQSETPEIQRPKTAKKKIEESEAYKREELFRRNFDKQFQQQEKIESVYQKRFVEPPKKKNGSKSSFAFPSLVVNKTIVGVLIAFVFVLGMGITTWAVAKAEYDGTIDQVKNLVSDVEEGRLTSAQERIEVLEKKQIFYTSVFGTVRPAIEFTLGQEKTEHMDQLLSVGKSGIDLAKSGLDTYALLEKGYKQFVDDEPGESVTTLQQATGRFEALYTNLAGFSTQVDQLENPFGIDDLEKWQDELAHLLPGARRSLLSAQQLSYVLPELLGQEGKRQYLVLLQNNQELRPTGGFIGSFGILTVEDGKLVDFKIEDVYEADGQLRGYVTPPPEIIQYLGEEQWFLRDVNWSADFPTVSQQAGWFLDKQIGIQPDGVIAVNLWVAQKLLAVTGPLDIPDYNEVVTEANLYERAQQRSELNFFPGSTQKKDFLSAVAQQMFIKLFQEETNKLLLGKVLLNAAEESQLLISLNEPTSAQVFHDLGWDGSVRTPSCPPPFSSQECFVDTVMQVEANVGVNKSNQFIERSISQTTNVYLDRAEHQRTISLQNNSKSNAWPGGPYRVYTRLYIPESAQVSQIMVDGVAVPDSEIREGVEVGKRVVGFYTEVAPQSAAKIEVLYSVPLPNTATVYALFEQKQSGTAQEPVEHVISVQEGSVLTVAPEPKIRGKEMVFTSQRETHDFMAVERR